MKTPTNPPMTKAQRVAENSRLRSEAFGRPQTASVQPATADLRPENNPQDSIEALNVAVQRLSLELQRVSFQRDELLKAAIDVVKQGQFYGDWRESTCSEAMDALRTAIHNTESARMADVPRS